MVMNKASSINNQFNSSNINNNNNNGSNRHLVANGKNVNNLLYYGHEAPRIDQYKASPRALLPTITTIFGNNKPSVKKFLF